MKTVHIKDGQIQSNPSIDGGPIGINAFSSGLQHGVHHQALFDSKNISSTNMFDFSSCNVASSSRTDAPDTIQESEAIAQSQLDVGKKATGNEADLLGNVSNF